VLARYAGPQPQTSAAWLLAPDTAYTLTFEIDPAHTISQTRRSAQQLAYPVLRWPDPAIESLTGDRPETFVWAGPVTSIVTATIRNGGYGTLASASAHFTATVGDQILYLNSVKEVPLLPPGSSTVVTHLLPLATPGSYVVTATLDSGDPDLDAGNNHAMLRMFAANAISYLPIMLRSSSLP
jgi:hypothetical protein